MRTKNEVAKEIAELEQKILELKNEPVVCPTTGYLVWFPRHEPRFFDTLVDAKAHADKYGSLGTVLKHVTLADV